MKDYFYHFLISFLLALYSTEVSIAVGLTKEFVDDRVYYNKWNWLDIFADSLGWILGTAIRLMIIGRWNWIILVL